MTVYVVQQDLLYEAFPIAGIFAKEEDAKVYAEKLNDEYNCDDHLVTPVEVQ